jgi:TIR domain
LGAARTYRERIQSALDSTHVTLVLIGDNWLASLPKAKGSRGKQAPRRIDDEDDWVRREVAAALERDDVTVVPVLVEGASMPDRSELPEDLSALPEIQYCELRNSEWPYDYRSSAGRLIGLILRAFRNGFCVARNSSFAKGQRRPNSLQAVRVSC